MGVALGDQAVVSVTNFGTTLIIGRSCLPEQFGRYVMAFSLMLLLSETLHALVSTPHSIFSPRLQGRALRRFNGSTLLHCLALGTLCLPTIGTAALLTFLHGGEGVPLSRVLFALALVTWAILLRYFGRVFSFNIRRPAAALGIDVTVMAAQLGGLGLLARTGHLNGWTAVLVVGGANGLAAAAWFAGSRGRFEPSPRAAAVELRQTWRLSRWVFVSGVLWVLGVHTYPWLIGALLGQDDVGVWGACFGIAAVANPLLMGLQNLVGPAIAHAYPVKSPAQFRRYVLVVTLAFASALVPFAALAAVFGDSFVRLYGDHYAGHGHVVAILALSCVAQAAAFSLSRGLFAIHQARQDTVANAIVLLILLLAGLPMIRHYGVAGAAACLVLCQAVGTLYRGVVFFSVSDKAETDIDADAPEADL